LNRCFVILYDGIQGILFLLFLPKLLWDRVVKGKFKQGLAPYLGFSLSRPPPRKKPVFLICAVSVGETKAASSLFSQMKQEFPEASFYIASRTETGQEEARKSFVGADGYYLLPLDFSGAVSRFLEVVDPDVVLIVESDFWSNLFRQIKQRKALLVLVSGKISASSYYWFQKVPFFTQKLFSFFDALFVQNVLYQQRFLALGVPLSKISVTGNLKFDIPIPQVDVGALRKKLGISLQDQVLIIASTHAPEEKLIVEVLKKNCLGSRRKILFVPRHPERFSEVRDLFIKESISFACYSELPQQGESQWILIDAMGVLASLYQIADVAVVGGSFVETLRGHNIFEPIQAGAVVFFGPYMSDQRDLVECVLTAQAGIQVSLEELFVQLRQVLDSPSLLASMQQKGVQLALQAQGSSLRTWEPIRKILQEKKESFEV